jgi:hypothetical protein
MYVIIDSFRFVYIKHKFELYFVKNRLAAMHIGREISSYCDSWTRCVEKLHFVGNDFVG